MTNKVAVVTDSTASIPEEMLEELNIRTVAYNTHRGQEVLRDLGASQPDFLLPLIQQPGLLLIGIDTAPHQAQVWSGKQAAAAQAANLIGIVQKNNPVRPRSRGGENEKATCI
jgi:hypothetical protein